MRTAGRRGFVAGALALALALSGCAASAPGPAASTSAAADARPVTTDEAQLLAIARFNNFDLGSRPFTAEVQERGTDLHLQGWVDYASLLGYAAVTGAFEPQALLWTATTVGIATQQPDSTGDPTLPIPALDGGSWTSSPLDAEASRLDALLATIGGLGADRPDNPLLVQQSGALWLREDEIDGTPVTVFAAPPSDEPLDASDAPPDADTSPLRLWVDESGLLRRAEIRIGDTWTTIDFPDTPGADLELPAGAL